MAVKAKKSFGQNFLVDQRVVRKIIAAADIQPGEAVLEIGPGTGILTSALVAAGASVTAVEADHDLIAPLQEKFGDKIHLIEGDIFSFLNATSYTLNATSFKLISNIPYNITSKILETFLTAKHPPSRMVLMVQREVADRITAKPPNMSLLSVVCQLYADVTKVVNVPASAFRPAPKVESAVVRLQHSSLNLPSNFEFRSSTLEPVICLAKIGFSSRRKQLHNNLSGAGLASADVIKKHLVSLGLSESARAETLSVHNWIALAGLL